MRKVMRYVQNVRNCTFTKPIADSYQKHGEYASAGEIIHPFNEYLFFRIGTAVFGKMKKVKYL